MYKYMLKDSSTRERLDKMNKTKYSGNGHENIIYLCIKKNTRDNLVVLTRTTYIIMDNKILCSQRSHGEFNKN